MSVFDPTAFLDSTTTDANSTTVIPIPAGPYRGYIKPGSLAMKQWQKKDDPSVCGWKLSCHITLDAPNVAEEIGRKELNVRHEIMLDTTEGGGLDFGKGKNVALGRLREALGQNVAGQPWSPRMMEGRPLALELSHRLDGEKIYEEVKSFSK